MRGDGGARCVGTHTPGQTLPPGIQWVWRFGEKKKHSFGLSGMTNFGHWTCVCVCFFFFFCFNIYIYYLRGCSVQCARFGHGLRASRGSERNLRLARGHWDNLLQERHWNAFTSLWNIVATQPARFEGMAFLQSFPIASTPPVVDINLGSTSTVKSYRTHPLSGSQSGGAHGVRGTNVYSTAHHLPPMQQVHRIPPAPNSNYTCATHSTMFTCGTSPPRKYISS